jgi:mannose-6-phosphate isomerase-like protein (cupin superfamily)
MKHKQLQFGKGFRVAIDSKRAQVAEMVIPPGEAEGDRRNRHRSADQWLYVVAGTGRATVNGQRLALKAGTLLWIEHKDRHEIRNTGRGFLRTLNFYTPRAYTKQGNPLPAARPR